MSFLPEEDQEFFTETQINHEEVTEKMPQGERRGVLFPNFALAGNLGVPNGRTFVAAQTCDLLVLVPDGYPTTKLDSFYTIPHLKHVDGSDPQNATGDAPMFHRSWQFSVAPS